MERRPFLEQNWYCFYFISAAEIAYFFLQNILVDIAKHKYIANNEKLLTVFLVLFSTYILLQSLNIPNLTIINFHTLVGLFYFSKLYDLSFLNDIRRLYTIVLEIPGNCNALLITSHVNNLSASAST